MRTVLMFTLPHPLPVKWEGPLSVIRRYAHPRYPLHRLPQLSQMGPHGGGRAADAAQAGVHTGISTGRGGGSGPRLGQSIISLPLLLPLLILLLLMPHQLPILGWWLRIMLMRRRMQPLHRGSSDGV